MARATTKEELIKASKSNFDNLFLLINSIITILKGYPLINGIALFSF